MFSDLEKDIISNSVFSEQKHCIAMERKCQTKYSKKGVTTEVKIFYKLLHRGCSDQADLIFTNSEQARKKLQCLVTSNIFGLKVGIIGHFQKKKKRNTKK